MSQTHPSPHLESRHCRFFPKGAKGFGLGLFRSRKGNDQIQLGASVDQIPYTPEYPVDLPIGPESIDIHRRQASCLLDQFFVRHGNPSVAQGTNTTTYVGNVTLHFCVNGEDSIPRRIVFHIGTSGNSTRSVHQHENSFIGAGVLS